MVSDRTELLPGSFVFRLVYIDPMEMSLEDSILQWLEADAHAHSTRPQVVERCF